MTKRAVHLQMHGADPNVTVSDNRTPLYIATKERCLNICNLLIAFGANLDIPDCTGQTPLHFACRNITGFSLLPYLKIHPFINRIMYLFGLDHIYRF